MISAIGIAGDGLLEFARFRGDISLGTDNRLYSGLEGGFVEFDCPEHIAVIGDGEGVETQFAWPG